MMPCPTCGCVLYQDVGPCLGTTHLIPALRAAYKTLRSEEVRIAPVKLPALDTVYEALKLAGVEP